MYLKKNTNPVNLFNNVIAAELRAKYSAQIAQIKSMGFNDDENTLRLLKLSDGNVEAAINSLVNA